MGGLGLWVPATSGWRPVLLRDVLQCLRERLPAVLPPPHRPSGPGGGACCEGKRGWGTGGQHRMVGAFGQWRGAPKRAAGGRAPEPGGPSPVAGTLAPPGRAGERRAGGAAGAVAAERGHLRRGQGGRGLKVGKEEADRRAGGRAPWPGGVTAREPGEVELGGGAGRGEGGRRGEGGGAGSVFGAPRQRGWRLPVRAGRCVCALLRSGRKMAQKGKLG